MDYPYTPVHLEALPELAPTPTWPVPLGAAESPSVTDPIRTLAPWIALGAAFWLGWKSRDWIESGKKAAREKAMELLG